MWKKIIINIFKRNGLEIALLVLVTFLGFKLLSLQINYTGGFDLIDAIATGFFGICALIYPLALGFKEYFEIRLKTMQQTDN